MKNLQIRIIYNYIKQIFIFNFICRKKLMILSIDLN